MRPGLATLDTELLREACGVEFIMVRLARLSCEGCGRGTPTGHTAYILEDAQHFHHLLCYECGRAAADYLGVMELADPSAPPAYGGGFTPHRISP